MSFTISEKWLADETSVLESNFDLMDRKFIECCILFKISENLLESKPFKTSRKFPYFEKISVCLSHAWQIFDDNRQSFVHD